MSSAEPVERTHDFAQRAFALMVEHGLAASPRNFTIWYTFVSGTNKGVNRVLQDHLSSGRPISQAIIDAIHEEFFSTKASEDAMLEFGRTMSEELVAVQTLLKTASNDTASYGSTLEGVSGQLAKGGDPQIIKVVVDQLVGATRQMVSRSRSLEDRLKVSTEEITRLKANIEAVRTEALTDELTNLPNRRAFDESLNRAVQRAQTLSEPLVLFMGDIDFFKRFNDTWGHQTGDQVLRLVAHCLRESVREQDVPARYGGEEFAVILPAATLDVAAPVAERVRKNVESKRIMKRSTGDDLGTITLSIGAALYRPGEDASELVKRADACLYAAKRAGRNRIVTERDIDPKGVLDEAAAARARKVAR